MRKIKHLEQCDYVVPIRQGSGQLLTLSNRSNVLLKRTWHREAEFTLETHVKFNADQMNGIQVLTSVFAMGKVASSQIDSTNLYRVSEADWSEALVGLVAMTETSNGIFEGNVSQATLGVNELSGMEVYKLVVVASRGRRKFTSIRWFNHLGCFDSLIRLRHATESLEILKVDE